MEKNKVFMLVFIFLCACNANQAIADNSNGFKSDELKNIRYISRAILKSRLNEKKRIDQELVGQRKELDQMRKVVETLELDMQKTLLAPDNLKVLQAVNTVASVSGGGKKPTNAPQTKPQAMPDSAIKQKRSARFKDAAGRLAGKRLLLEKTQPTWWMVWKKKDRKQQRTQKMIEVSKKIEVRLNAMAARDKVDMQGISKLKEMLTLKRPQINIKDMDSTIQTRTK